MLNKNTDIGDDEIRIISSLKFNDFRNDIFDESCAADIGEEEEEPLCCDTDYETVSEHPRKRKPHWGQILIAVLISAAIAIIVTLIVVWQTGDEADDAAEEVVATLTEQPAAAVPDSTVVPVREKAFTVASDISANGVALRLLTPRNATPALEVGDGALTDSTVVLAAQAADIRKDNGMIVGTYIAGGQLLSKGEAKAGFCSIINGELTVGVADATALLEQALTSDGYFFRQYPLVVAGQIVENKPKGRAIRKALAEMADGTISIVISRQKLTFHDFSQALVDAGVRNAIYLVGSGSAGVYTDSDGRRMQFGKVVGSSRGDNTNFIVWR